MTVNAWTRNWLRNSKGTLERTNVILDAAPSALGIVPDSVLYGIDSVLEKRKVATSSQFHFEAPQTQMQRCNLLQLG